MRLAAVVAALVALISSCAGLGGGMVSTPSLTLHTEGNASAVFGAGGMVVVYDGSASVALAAPSAIAGGAFIPVLGLTLPGPGDPAAGIFVYLPDLDVQEVRGRTEPLPESWRQPLATLGLDAATAGALGITFAAAPSLPQP